MSLRSLLLGMAVFGLPALAMAQTPAPAAPAQQMTINIIANRAPEGRQLADEQTVKAIRKSGEAGGLGALCQRTGDLRAVLEHAPASFPMLEAKGDDLTVRGETPQQTMSMALLNGMMLHSRNVVLQYDTYPDAALLLGSCENEQKHWDAAIRWLDRGLAMQPDHTLLTSEKAASLEGLHRPADALALVDALLAKNYAYMSPDLKALLLRNKGFALVELKRLDEGETAYQESLKAQPGHRGALNELTYIAQLRGGRPPANSVVTTSDKALSGDFGQSPKP